MKIKYSFILFILLLALSQPLSAQTYCMSYNVVSIVGSDATVKVSLVGSAAFNLGDANLLLNFNPLAVSSPTLVSNTLGVRYSPTTVTNPATGLTSINIDFNGITGEGLAIGTVPTEIAVIKFTVLSNTQTSGFSINLANCTVYNDNTVPGLLTIDPGCPSLNVALPVELLSFDATKDKTNTLLTWKTTNALQMSHFDVERSQDGKTFAPIGQSVKTINTIDKMSYNLTDEKPFAGINYYRLKSVESSGKSAYSKVVSVLFGTDFTAKVFPNPFHDVLTLDIKSDHVGTDMTFELIDVLGQQVTIQKRKTTSGSFSVTFNTLDLTAGAYIVRVKDADNVWQDKFVKY